MAARCGAAVVASSPVNNHVGHWNTKASYCRFLLLRYFHHLSVLTGSVILGPGNLEFDYILVLYIASFSRFLGETINKIKYKEEGVEIPLEFLRKKLHIS
ncbi:1-acyl-sn-glycerol-3-phosphate acyltransferase [Sesbania bispinosa]|nr:1-acyl-sn-glycerol-3-phosphate acyltransferase [Sesbania bispinosa]